MIFRLVCRCGARGRAEVQEDRLPPHISPVVAALRRAAKLGWKYRNGRMGKSVISVVCPRCRGRGLYLEADIVPAEASPSTHEEDLAVPDMTDEEFTAATAPPPEIVPTSG